MVSDLVARGHDRVIEFDGHRGLFIISFPLSHEPSETLRLATPEFRR